MHQEQRLSWGCSCSHGLNQPATWLEARLVAGHLRLDSASITLPGLWSWLPTSTRAFPHHPDSSRVCNFRMGLELLMGQFSSGQRTKKIKKTIFIFFLYYWQRWDHRRIFIFNYISWENGTKACPYVSKIWCHCQGVSTI